MKKWTIVSLIVAVFAFALVGCGGNQEANTGANNTANNTAGANGNKADFVAEEVKADQAAIDAAAKEIKDKGKLCLLYTSPSPRDS